MIAPEQRADRIGSWRAMRERVRSEALMRCVGQRARPPMSKLAIVICVAVVKWIACAGPEDLPGMQMRPAQPFCELGTVDANRLVATTASVLMSGFIRDSAMLDVGPHVR